MPSILKLKSKSKVNIGLRIINKRKDGFHNIHTVFQELDFHDTLTISKSSSGCSFSSNVDWLDNSSDNLCIKAYELMNEIFDIGGISIALNKVIPPGGGLGGGSSNAASVIKGINELYDLGISYRDLERISSQIGADVPFFIKGGLQLGEGLGTKLTQIKKKIDGFFKIARAMATLCFSPPDSFSPRSPTIVSYPSGSAAINPSIAASLAADTISS